VNLEFLGACKEVGRSGILIDTGTEKFVLDYGVKIDGKPSLYPKKVHAKLDGIFLSHAHLDHVGALPVLYKYGQKCRTYGIDITKQLTRMLLKDSIKIAKAENQTPMFSERDASIALKHFKSVNYKKRFNIGKTRITFFDAGHIPGSAMILLENKGKTLLYTGDFNVSNTRLLKGTRLEDLDNIDTLIMENTYSDREHPDRRKEELRFVDSIRATLANDGIAVLASFAISRAQEMILILDDFDIKYPIYVDGMAQKATDIINKHPGLQREYNKLEKAMQRSNINYIKHASQRKKILKKPCIILTTSGMLSGGPVVWYIKKLHERPESSIFLTGFQIPNTEGDILMKTGRYTHEDMDLKVKMNVNKYDFSAHASHSELIKTIKKINPSQIFCMHGEKTEKFADELRQNGFAAEAAELKNYEL